MRLAIILGICLTFIVVVHSFAEEVDSRHQSCKKDEDCKGGCCRGFWFWKKCFPKRKLGEPCRPNVHVLEKFCHHRCEDGLVCRRSRRPGRSGSPDGRHPHHPHHHMGYRCHRAPPPTQEPGSGDHDF